MVFAAQGLSPLARGNPVWWTMFSGRQKGELPEDAQRDKDDRKPKS